MVFFLWGVFRGKKRNSLHQVPNKLEQSAMPQVVSISPADKISSAEDVCSLGSMDKVLFILRTYVYTVILKLAFPSTVIQESFNEDITADDKWRQYVIFGGFLSLCSDS